MKLMDVFKKIGQGLLWVPKEIGKLFSELPKLLTVTSDAKKLASDVFPKLMTLLNAVAAFVTATIKDGGQFLTALSALGVAVTAAVEAGGINIMADEAVVAAFEGLVKLFQQSHVGDILTAWKALVEAAHDFDATAVADLQKLESDAVATS
jgi:hypothetical protein